MIGLWVLAGAVVGTVNALTRWWTVTRLQTEMPSSALALTLGGMGMRLIIVAALLIKGLERGIIPGLLAFGGLWVARSAAVIWVQTAGNSLLSGLAGGTCDRPSRSRQGQ